MAHEWVPPAEVIDAGERADVKPSWPYSVIGAGESVQRSIPEGVKAFRDYVCARFGLPAEKGGMRRGGASSSPKTAGDRRDPHEEGLAVDVMTRDPELGDRIANWLVTHAEAIGVWIVIWSQREWSTGRPPRWERYTGASPHTDHVHVELSREAAALSRAAMLERLARLEPGAVAGPLVLALVLAVGAWGCAA